MGLVIVYRVQDKSGRGPWKPGKSHRWRDAQDKSLLPWFLEWRGFNPKAESFPGEAIGCGCLEKEHLRMWFTEQEYMRLRILGYQAVAMKADRILKSSENQCVFARRQALRKRVNPFELYADD